MFKNHWLIRVGDGENLKKSKYMFWGVKRGRGDCIKSLIKNNFKEGDIIWFITNKKAGGKCIAMCEYITFYDKQDEKLININTISNKEQNWNETEVWDIQINYKNLYFTENQNIKICIQCSSIILKYLTFKDKIEDDLVNHYNNFKFYAVPNNTKISMI